MKYRFSTRTRELVRRMFLRSKTRVPAFLFLLAGAAAPLFADVTIAQIDPSRLLTQQRVDVYVSVTDSTGHPVNGLTSSNFKLFEGPSANRLEPVANFQFHEGGNTSEGITFYLLVDNSGSMYEQLDSGGGSLSGRTRIEAARAAIRTFLNSADNPADRIGLAAFNTFYRVVILPTDVRSRVEDALSRIHKPSAPDSYTELYASLQAAAEDLAATKGRKVVILLTDGENYPYAEHTGKPNPQFGTHLYTSTEAIRALIQDGVSVFPIHFGPARQDRHLAEIAESTGGRVYDARSEKELANVYLDVRRRVLQEYRLSYSPRMIPGDRRTVKVQYTGPGGQGSALQYYFVGTLFGSPAGRWSPYLLIPFVLALLAWFLVSRLRFLNKRSGATLEVLGDSATKVFPITGGRTLINFDSPSGVTLTAEEKSADQGSGGLGQEGKTQRPFGGEDATVIRDESTGEFTVVSNTPIMVNNRPTQHRKLRPGDVIRMGDATVVFDEQSDKENPKKQ